MRALRTVGRNGDINNSRIDFLQFFIAETAPFESTGTVVLAEDIGLPDQFGNNFLGLRGFYVEGEALHTAVMALKTSTGETWENLGSP